LPSSFGLHAFEEITVHRNHLRSLGIGEVRAYALSVQASLDIGLIASRRSNWDLGLVRRTLPQTVPWESSRVTPFLLIVDPALQVVDRIPDASA
jgi:hypothetical protein